MSLNKVMLIGHVGADPEIRYIEQNIPVGKLRLATTERGYTASNGIVIPDQTEWHTIILYRRLAEYADRYVKKGAQLFVEGKLRNRMWVDKSGIKHYVAEIQADTIELMGTREANKTQDI